MRRAFLIGIFALAACHHHLKSYPEIVTVQKADDVDEGALNVFERCKPLCMNKGKRVIEAWESATDFRCHCAPFDA